MNGALTTRAVLMMVIAMALIAIQEALAKYLGQYIPVTQVVWARYSGHLILMLVLLMPKHGLSVFKSQIPLMQTGRSLLLLLDTLMFFTGLTMIGVAEATAIFFCVPFFVLLLSIPLLGERVGWHSFAAIFVGFFGMILILRPESDGLNIGGLLILAAAVCMAFFNITTRRLAGADRPEVTMVFTAMVGFVVTSIAMPFFWKLPTEPLVWAAMISLGLFGGIGHSLLILAHEETQASKIAPFMYSQIIFAVALGWLMFDMLPDIYTATGAVIVILSGLYLWKRGRL